MSFDQKVEDALKDMCLPGCGQPTNGPFAHAPGCPHTPARALVQIDQCPSCGAYDPRDYTLEEVDIGIGIQTHLCDDSYHDEARWGRR